jgi:hypothetical protein
LTATSFLVRRLIVLRGNKVEHESSPPNFGRSLRAGDIAVRMNERDDAQSTVLLDAIMRRDLPDPKLGITPFHHSTEWCKTAASLR